MKEQICTFPLQLNTQFAQDSRNILSGPWAWRRNRIPLSAEKLFSTLLADNHRTEVQQTEIGTSVEAKSFEQPGTQSQWSYLTDHFDQPCENGFLLIGQWFWCQRFPMNKAVNSCHRWNNVLPSSGNSILRPAWQVNHQWWNPRHLLYQTMFVIEKLLLVSNTFLNVCGNIKCRKKKERNSAIMWTEVTVRHQSIHPSVW